MERDRVMVDSAEALDDAARAAGEAVAATAAATSCRAQSRAVQAGAYTRPLLSST